MLQDTIATGQPGDLTAGLQAYVLPRTAADGAHTFRQACCTVRYIHLGKSLVVWAATESMGTRSVCLSPDAISTAVAGSTEQGVVLAQTASHRIHDELLLPVLQALCQEEGLSPPSSLRTLPMEIRMLILHSLPVRLPSSYHHHLFVPMSCRGQCAFPTANIWNMGSLSRCYAS